MLAPTMLACCDVKVGVIEAASKGSLEPAWPALSSAVAFRSWSPSSASRGSVGTCTSETETLAEIALAEIAVPSRRSDLSSAEGAIDVDVCSNAWYGRDGTLCDGPSFPGVLSVPLLAELLGLVFVSKSGAINVDMLLCMSMAADGSHPASGGQHCHVLAAGIGVARAITDAEGGCGKRSRTKSKLGTERPCLLDRSRPCEFGWPQLSGGGLGRLLLATAAAAVAAAAAAAAAVKFGAINSWLGTCDEGVCCGRPIGLECSRCMFDDARPLAVLPVEKWFIECCGRRASANVFCDPRPVMRRSKAELLLVRVNPVGKAKSGKQACLADDGPVTPLCG